MIVYPQNWGAATFDSNSSIFSNFTFSWPSGLDYNSTTIVVIHEKSATNPDFGERTTLSALSWTLDQSVENESFSLWIPLIFIGFLIALFQILAQKGELMSTRSKLKRLQVEIDNLRNESIDEDIILTDSNNQRDD